MYSEEIKNELLKVRREKSYSCQKLSEMFNVSIQTVYIWVREDKKNSPTKKRDTIIKLFKEENRSPKSLSEEYDVPLSTVYDWLYQSGVELTKEQKKESESSGRERYTTELLDTIRELRSKIKELETKNKSLQDNVFYLTELLNRERNKERNKEEEKQPQLF